MSPFYSPHPSDHDQIMVEVIRFQIKKYVAQYEIPAENLELRSWVEQDANRMVLSLVRKVAFIASKGELRIETPRSWWQHLKQTLFLVTIWGRFLIPAWVKERWPVKYKVELYRAEAMFDKLPIPGNRPEFEVGFFDWSKVR